MGSFNEVCALSGINIGYGTKVKQLFLTEQPCRDARGCYPTAQWFVRTPPISGVYDDYGKIKFKESPITDLICEVFQSDVVEQPFGFNQYHDPDVTKTKGIHHLLNCAWEDRLKVQDEYHRSYRKIPESFPTWQKIHAIFRENKLPVQLDSKKDEGCEGYNAQPIIPGVVCVDFNSYDDNTKRLQKAQAILEKLYDCKLINKIEDRPGYEVCLMVAPKGAWANNSILHDVEGTAQILDRHPGNYYPKERTLRVVSVMVREDVWQTYCTVNTDPKYPSPWDFKDRPNQVDTMYEKLDKICDKYRNRDKEKHFYIGDLAFREILFEGPFCTVPTTHILKALEKNKFPMDKLLRACAELARVEYVMSHLCHTWYVPQLGGQDGNWGLRTALFTQLTAICQKELDEQMAEYDPPEEEDDEDVE